MFQPKLLYRLTFEGSWPTAVAFLDSPRQVAAGNQDGQLYVWNLPETPPENPPKRVGGQPPDAPDVPPARRLDGHTNAISRLLFDPKRRQIVSSSFDQTIRFWPVDASPTGTDEAVLDTRWRNAEFKRTKKEDVLNAPGAKVETFAAGRVLEGHEDWVQTLGASGDFSRLISGDARANVIVWDVDAGAPVSKWTGHAWNWIVAARLSSDGQTAAVAEFRYKRDDFDLPAAAFKVWNVADGTEKLDILQVQFPKLKPDATTYGSAQVWRKFIADGLVALSFSPDDTLIAAGQGGETDTGRAHLVETQSGKLVRDLSGHRYGMPDLCFSRDGKRLFTAGRDTCVRIVQVDDGKELAVLGSPRGGQFKDWISAIALSPDETHLAAADIEGSVAVWRLRD